MPQSIYRIPVEASPLRSRLHERFSPYLDAPGLTRIRGKQSPAAQIGALHKTVLKRLGRSMGPEEINQIRTQKALDRRTPVHIDTTGTLLTQYLQDIPRVGCQDVDFT